jgi:hypothetical protein
LKEARRLDFRFEVFNSANHPNWGPPDVTLLDATFGKVTSTRTNMRQLQGSLKFIFYMYPSSVVELGLAMILAPGTNGVRRAGRNPINLDE